MRDDSYSSRVRFVLSYQLKNGRTLQRMYLVPRAGFEPELKAVMEHADYKRERYQTYRMKENVESIWLGNLNKAVTISDPQEVQEFKDILTREILNMSYEDQFSDQRARAAIRVRLKPDQYGNSVNYSYDWFPPIRSWGLGWNRRAMPPKSKLLQRMSYPPRCSGISITASCLPG